MEFGQYVRETRKSKGLTLRELSKRSGVSHPYLSQLENGKNDKPSLDIIDKLAKGLNVSNAELLKQAGLFERLDHEANLVKFGLLMNKHFKEQENSHLEMIHHFCKDFIELYESKNPNALGAAERIVEQVTQIHELKKAEELVGKATQDELTGFELIED